MISSFSHLTERGLAAEKSQRWQRRHEELLRAACRHVAQKVGRGKGLLQTIKKTALTFHGKNLGDGRKLSLSEKSLERHWYRYRLKGEAALGLHYRAGRKAEIDPQLLQFLVEKCVRETGFVSQILTELAAGSTHIVDVSLRTLHRALPVGKIRRFVLTDRRLRARRESAEQNLRTIDSQIRILHASAEAKSLRVEAAMEVDKLLRAGSRLIARRFASAQKVLALDSQLRDLRARTERQLLLQTSEEGSRP